MIYINFPIIQEKYFFFFSFLLESGSKILENLEILDVYFTLKIIEYNNR